MSTLSERRRRGWPVGFPVVQTPNPPLLVALAGWLVDKAAGGSAYARAVFLVGLAVWAWHELTDGANWVRRVFGAAGLVYVVVSVGASVDTRSG
jgi:hypothetical protein